MKQLNKKPKPVITLFGALVGLAVAAVAFNLTSSWVNNNTLDKALEKYNKNLPQQIDEYMRIDSLKIPSTNVLNYYMTVNIDKADADFLSIKENIHPYILNNIKTEPSLRVFRKNKYTWKYLFYDKNGAFFHEFMITPDMYQ